VIIDTHTHFYDPSRPQGVPWPVCGRSGEYATTVTVMRRYIRESGKGAQEGFWSGNATRAYGLSTTETPA